MRFVNLTHFILFALLSLVTVSCETKQSFIAKDGAFNAATRVLGIPGTRKEVIDAAVEKAANEAENDSASGDDGADDNNDNGGTTSDGGSQTGGTTSDGGSQTGGTTSDSGSQTGGTTSDGGSQAGGTTSDSGSQTGGTTSDGESNANGGGGETSSGQCELTIAAQERHPVVTKWFSLKQTDGSLIWIVNIEKPLVLSLIALAQKDIKELKNGNAWGNRMYRVTNNGASVEFPGSDWENETAVNKIATIGCKISIVKK